jgi:uroporphyrinogen decarboxylase
MSTKPLIQAALGKTPSRTPIWFLRQAGRYLPEYRNIRAQHSFLEVCQNPDLAAEVTLQPLRRYDVDAAIIFSDILIPAVAMGQSLSFDKGHGPVLTDAVRSSKEFAKLRRPDADKDLGYVGDAIRLTKKSMNQNQAMIGFAGAPYTVACYMIEGGGSKDFAHVKSLMFRDPDVFAKLLDLITETTIDYLLMQQRAGADCLMLFDTWAGALTSADYQNLIVPRLLSIMRAVKTADVPLIYFPGQGSDRYLDIGALKAADVIAVDWRVPIPRALSQLRSIGLNPTIQGNLEPASLLAPENIVRSRTRDVLDDGRQARAHIFNVGHGLIPSVPPEAVGWVIDEIRRSSTKN